MMFFVYEIRNKTNGKTYIGVTKKIPMHRWSQHFLSLISNSHDNKLLQIAWNESKFYDWNFSVLEKITTESYSKATRIEGSYVLKIPEELRLNGIGSYTKTQVLFDEVIKRIVSGKKYKDISQELGVSLGTISNIKKEYMMQKIEDFE